MQKFLDKWMKKKTTMLVAAFFAASTLTFSGCSASTATNPTSTSAAAAQQEAAEQSLSDARNTPVVRAAKAVGPSVVGITNKAVARDWFNNPVETEGVGSGVILL